MVTGKEVFQTLLAEMQTGFLDELPERCRRLETLTLSLEKSPTNREIFTELCRGVHNLKGAGGTHKLPVITSLCHQLEDLLVEADTKQAFKGSLVTQVLAHIDLLWKIAQAVRSEHPDYSAIETCIETLRIASLQHRKAVLIAESSVALATFYRQTLADQKMHFSFVQDGLAALERLLHERFDLVIMGRELKTLNSHAILAALRASKTINTAIPAVIVTSGEIETDSDENKIPADTILARDTQLSRNILTAVEKIFRRN